MPEEYVKYRNILEKHVIEKHGSINNFISTLENLDNSRYEKLQIERAVKNSDFAEILQIGMKICSALRIDFAELFINNHICEIDSAVDFCTRELAEEKYSRLNLNAQKQALRYIDNILEN